MLVIIVGILQLSEILQLLILVDNLAKLLTWAFVFLVILYLQSNS